MGPQGSLAENERVMFNNANALEYIQPDEPTSKIRNNQIKASQNINPVLNSVQGNAFPNNNLAGKAYFGQAGIAGTPTGQNNMSPHPTQRQALLGPSFSPGGNQIGYPEANAKDEDDDFWYQTENGNTQANDIGNTYGQQNRLF